MTDTADGLILSLPVSDDRELQMKVLQFGGQARVVSPESLKNKLRTEIERMMRHYNGNKEAGQQL